MSFCFQPVGGSNNGQDAGSSPSGHHADLPFPFARFATPDPEGVTFNGTFWDSRGQRLNTTQFCLNGEDTARGIIAFGVPGSGKTQAVILPLIADHMVNGHSLIIADPQGELTPYLKRLTAVTGHALAVHDPTYTDTLRFNLAEDVATASDARAVATVLVPIMPGDNRFWSEAAIAVLAAGLLRYRSLGATFLALSDLKTFSSSISQIQDDAYLLANSFISGIHHNEWRLASNVVAVLAASLAGWAAYSVRQATAVSDFTAAQLVERPTVVILACPARTREAFAPYLGAVLCKLILDLDTLGQQHGGPLPIPIGLVMDEFPSLGRLDGLLTNINLTRKRRISVLLAAQTQSQMRLHYGEAGTEVLLSGLATQIVFGGGDLATATYYAEMGRRLAMDVGDAMPSPITLERIFSPPQGNCTVFTRYADANSAAHVVLHARLLRFYENRVWQDRMSAAAELQPHLLARSPRPTISAPSSAIPMVYDKLPNAARKSTLKN